MERHELSQEDRDFRSAFEACTVAPSEFTHEAHVRLAYVYLVESDVETAVRRMREALLEFIERNGIPRSKFHETITRAWVLAVRHFMNKSGGRSFAAFIAENPQLLDSKVMLTHYSASVLFSPDARAAFVEPDLDPIPPKPKTPTPHAAHMSVRTLPFRLVDVFAREPLSGNGLSVFLLDDELPAPAMQRITQEMRQFETIFLARAGETSQFRARIFTMEEELPFAGHPVIGAAAVLHAELHPADESAQFEFVLPGRSVHTASRRDGSVYFADMDQGAATVGAPIGSARNDAFLQALNLSSSDLASGLPLQVVSTGLPYLIVPVGSNLERARIVVPDFEPLLATVGAKFVYVFDVNRREGRTWDNDGRVEDIATGSAAGPAAAYLVTHELAARGESLVIAQGRFLDRPSELHATVRGGAALSVSVRGQVCLVGEGALRLPDRSLQRPRNLHGDADEETGNRRP